ncbi:MAG: hypothetical protein NTV46_02000, partial [Verrucomicrobia bacterium]|nr:hypothetical protein [Verrucomicrobiota bacterium]
MCHRGFALVVTLSLMILLTVLAVGLLSLSAITLRTVEREAAAAVARANARVALMIALGELQTQLGPDRRIAQFAHPDVVGSAATAGRSRYLSVHDMNKKDGGVSPPWNRRATESFRTWLVSGDSAEVTNPSFPGAATPMHTVRLTSSNVPEKDSVSVPVTRIGQATGDFAWWIDDLGQKASLITAKAADESLRHVNPDRFLLSHALTDGSLSWFPDAPEHPARDRLVSRETAGILAPDRAQVSTLERWLGGTHFGLLADPHNGGLKKDLSAAFGSDLRTLVDALGERIFQSVDGAPTVDDPGGPKWAQLRSFYELAASSGALPVRPQTDEQMGIYPVIAGFVEMFGVSNTVGYSPAADRYLGTDGWYNYQGGTTPNYVMTVHMAPVLKLWNPYNRPLETAAYTIVVGNSDAQYVDGVQADETTFFWADTRPSNLPAGMRFEHRYHIPSVSFAPGEVKLFSLHENTFLDMFGGTYIPQTGLALGKKTDVVNAGFILGELGESPFTGHSFWDMHCTWPGLKAANAANLKYGHGRACENGYVYSPGRASDDGGDVTINDSRSKDTKAYRINVGKLVTWSLRLYKGRVAKGGYERPLVSIKNINTADIAPANTIKNHPNIPELDNPVSDPYFAGNRNLDATWARRISLRFLQNEGDHDPALYNGDGAQRPIKDIKWLADFNPRSPTIGCWPAEFSKRPDAFDPFAPVYPGGPLLINGAAGGSTLGYGLATPGNYLSGILMNPTNKAALEMNKFIGYSDDEGVSRCVLFEIPDFAS